MKPLLQVFGLDAIFYNIPNFRAGAQRTFKIKLDYIKQITPEDKYEKKENSLKDKQIKALIFDDMLIKIKNKKDGNRSITNFFGVKK